MISSGRRNLAVVSDTFIMYHRVIPLSDFVLWSITLFVPCAILLRKSLGYASPLENVEKAVLFSFSHFLCAVVNFSSRG